MNQHDIENNIKNPVFIFGCCNSGTTILWQALKRHPDLSGPDIESQDLEGLPDSMKHYLGKSTFRLWAHPKFKLCYYRSEQDYNEADRTKISALYKQYQKPQTRFIAKSPADTLRARLIQAYFPDAYFIAIVRNGYAVSEGIIRKRKYDSDRPQFEGLYTAVDEAAEQWFRANTIMISHEKFLRRYKIIKYEDLVETPKDTLSSVLDFCELDTKDFPVPHFDSRLNEQQISRLSGYDLETITRIAQPMFIHCEYPVIGKELKWG